MPTINLSKKDMERLLARKLPNLAEELNDVFQYVGGEVESICGDDISIEIKCRSRPDLWSAEGITRDLRGALNKEVGLKKYSIKPSGVTVTVESEKLAARPYCSCAIVKNVKVDDFFIKQMIQLQEKMNQTFGRKRRAVGTGIYDFNKVTPQIRYTGGEPDKVSFAPLDFTEVMTLNKILQRHPKGRDYGHLLEGQKYYPLFIDSANRIMSMPPIINSNYSGKVTEKTKDLFVESTGLSWKETNIGLLITVAALADRGGKIESVKIKYQDKIVITPDFSPQTWLVGLIDINNRLGLNLTANQATELLRRARYDVKIKNKGGFEFLEAQAPAYRADIMHDVDLIEDIAIMYGYSNFEPQTMQISTVGALSPRTEQTNKIRKLMLGFGAQEIQTFTLASLQTMTTKTCRADRALVKIENPLSENFEYLRDEIWPMLIDFAGKNKTKSYPQIIFEVGDVVIPNRCAENRSDTKKHLAFACASNDADFTYAKRVLASLLANLGLAFEIKQVEHASFISGRAGSIVNEGKSLGVVGEVHPQVLQNYGIEMPVVVFEINLNGIYYS